MTNKKQSVFDYVEIVTSEPRGWWNKLVGKPHVTYVCIKDYTYHSKRYNKDVTAKVGDEFDGATGALDIDSFGWLIHDVLCRDGAFDDGSKCDNWQASQVLSDILKSEGRWFRSKTWGSATWLFGGGKARDNGMV